MSPLLGARTPGYPGRAALPGSSPGRHVPAAPSGWPHEGGPYIWEGTMKTRILSALAAALVALGMSGGAAADTQTAAIEALERERAAAIETLARERAPYPRYFAN